MLALMAGYGCMTGRPAPVSDRAAQPSAAPAAKPVQAPATAPASAPVAGAPETDPRPEFYTVKKGDTLYLIALDHGLDYKELAEWNGIENPNVIRIGQQLRLRAPASTVVTAPLKTPPKVEGRPVAGAAPAVAANEAVKSQPKAVKVPYSDQALAQLSGQAQPPSKPAVAPSVIPPVVPPVAKADPAPEEKPAASAEDDEKVAWGWPASGKVLTTFNESTNLKGIGIAGKLGQPVIASAPGKVLYSGDGIRGYGKLVIIKHNKVYISVYAHNQLLLVKEGQSVVKGQKIADMGASDADQVKLHFEIRRFGKPIDPLKLLPGDRPA
ncbi:MAG TPA: peptidoglycan DD-metalloendopeptidase family protein [Burkholderiales bacterium]|nr:peptidoglycan DD-metalloendopeptidase family protein [Burkholderiales bacterium]